MRIAVDAMGGDHGPAWSSKARSPRSASLVIPGARRGHGRIEASWRGLASPPPTSRSGTRPRSSDGREPSQALRRKRDSSLRVAAGWCATATRARHLRRQHRSRDGRGDVRRGVLRGVDRPASPPSANSAVHRAPRRRAKVDRSRGTVQFAVMGNVYARDILAIDRRASALSWARRGQRQRAHEGGVRAAQGSR